MPEILTLQLESIGAAQHAHGVGGESAPREVQVRARSEQERQAFHAIVGARRDQAQIAARSLPRRHAPAIPPLILTLIADDQAVRVGLHQHVLRVRTGASFHLAAANRCHGPADHGDRSGDATGAANDETAVDQDQSAGHPAGHDYLSRHDRDVAFDHLGSRHRQVARHTARRRRIEDLLHLIRNVARDCAQVPDFDRRGRSLLRRRDGLSVFDAVTLAGRRRLRPILMTTFTTILALLPMAFGFGEGGVSRRLGLR